MLIFYNIAMALGIVLGFPLVVPMVLGSKKRRKTLLQRLGFTLLPLSQRPLWIHALSVGEVISAIPLVKALKTSFKHGSIVFSASTLTGFQIANRLLRGYVNGVFFFPYDLLFSVKHVITGVDPSCTVIVESDIWPNFLFEMKRREIPVLLVNARLSEKSFSGYRRFRFLVGPALRLFARICTQTAEDARRFQQLGVSPERIEKTGNLKFDQESEPIPLGRMEELRQWMQVRPGQRIFLAGSTHKGEEEVILEAWSKMKQSISGLFLIVAPRHPDRAESVREIFRSAGFSAYALKDIQEGKPVGKVDLIVIDTLGLLRSLYALADIAFVGGSLVDLGGHNPLEPAIFSKPIVFGPNMSNFRLISQMLLESGGAVCVRDAESLVETTSMLFSHPDRSKAMGNKAFEVVMANRGATGKTVEVVMEVIEKRSRP